MLSQRPRQGAHPLTYGDLGQHLVDQVRRHVRHATRHARRAKATRFARKRHDDFLVTSLAAQPHAAMFEKAAPQVTLDLAPHKLRQSARLVAAIDEARPGALHNFMERRFLAPLT